MKKALSFSYITRLRQSDSAWRLLCAHNAPLIASFLFRTFIAEDRRSLDLSEAISLLDDYLFELKQTHGDEAPGRGAKEYIDEWSKGESPFLSLRYVKGKDTPEVDLTAGAEKALRWIDELEGSGFVGTESRLLNIFELLEELVQHTESDPAKILDRLRKRQIELEREISEVQQGHIQTHDSTRIKERLFQLNDTARKLLADFRQVEENFRTLDRQIREKAVTAQQDKGVFLDQVFGEQDAIDESDQGRSFRAFWDLLLQGRMRQQFTELLDHTLALREAAVLADQDTLRTFFDSLVSAGNKIKRVTNQLTSQLRKYLDDRSLLENRRVMELIQDIEKKALQLAADHPKGTVTELDSLHPEFNLDLNRPLQEIGTERLIEIAPELASLSEQRGVPLERLFAARGVDEGRLRTNIEKAVARDGQIGLRELLERHPLEKGLAELLVYLKIASERKSTLFDDQVEDHVHYRDSSGAARQIRLGRVILTREV